MGPALPLASRFALVLAALTAASCEPRGETHATQPAQPTSGAGGSDYLHARAVITRVRDGLTDPEGYWLIEPADPTPTTAPVLVYLHGYGASEPDDGYEAMLVHFARKGWVVVFPWQGLPLEFSDHETNARRAVLDALGVLRAGGHPTPDGRISFVGHSLGASLALRMAASGEPALPSPDAVVLHDPQDRRLFPDMLPAELLATVPATVHVLVIQSETSAPGGPDANGSFASQVWLGTSHIPRARRGLLRLHSDRHGTPILLADHDGCRSGYGGLPLDAHDVWGYWRPTESALREAMGEPFSGHSAFCSDPAPACEAVRDQGRWSDGTPVTPLENAADLGL